ncbi:MAG: hypothetical protein ACRDJ9_19985, partial [Dehalococcoidia bacterium]
SSLPAGDGQPGSTAFDTRTTSDERSAEGQRDAVSAALPPTEPDRTQATPPSLLPWLGYALLGLLTMTGLAAGALAPLQIG